LRRYGKLVRDKVPEIIRGNSNIPNIRIMDKDEYRRELLYKLIEESEEVRRAGYNQDNNFELIEKLADLSEVFDATLTEFDISKKTIKLVQDKYCKERGGFDKKIFLESIQEK